MCVAAAAHTRTVRPDQAQGRQHARVSWQPAALVFPHKAQRTCAPAPSPPAGSGASVTRARASAQYTRWWRNVHSARWNAASYPRGTDTPEKRRLLTTWTGRRQLQPPLATATHVGYRYCSLHFVE
jgi:hypothetical protein